MAKRQTRKGVSFAKPIYDAIMAEAASRKLPASHFVELLVRAAIPGLPETHHMPVAHVATMKQRRPPRRGTRESTLRAVPPVSRGSGSSRTQSLPPSALELAELRIECSRKLGRQSNNGKSLAELQSRERKVSVAFAAELRRRGWLAPEREGYGRGSWAAQ